MTVTKSLITAFNPCVCEGSPRMSMTSLHLPHNGIRTRSLLLIESGQEARKRPGLLLRRLRKKKKEKKKRKECQLAGGLSPPQPPPPPLPPGAARRPALATKANQDRAVNDCGSLRASCYNLGRDRSGNCLLVGARAV